MPQAHPCASLPYNPCTHLSLTIAESEVPIALDYHHTWIHAPLLQSFIDHMHIKGAFHGYPFGFILPAASNAGIEHLSIYIYMHTSVPLWLPCSCVCMCCYPFDSSLQLGWPLNMHIKPWPHVLTALFSFYVPYLVHRHICCLTLRQSTVPQCFPKITNKF